MGGRPIPPHSSLNGGFNFYSSQIDKLRVSLNATPRSHDRMKLLTKMLFTKQSGLVLVLLAASGSLSAAQIANNNITEAEIKAAQDAWGKALIQISDDYRSGGIDKARATATAVLDGAYGYHHGPVLFKPTLAGGEQTFRINQEGALAYFVGNNQAYPADTGFALKNWQSYNYDNAAVYINGDMALTMGKVRLTDRDNKQTTVDKTWGFKKGDDGKVRIVLHHSSLPYAG
ncbi:TPA: hypothetical protein F3L15_18630 [Aeromonas hydrophila]|nr:hypothetical protein [Aeromonas hydrophila]